MGGKGHHSPGRGGGVGAKAPWPPPPSRPAASGYFPLKSIVSEFNQESLNPFKVQCGLLLFCFQNV